MNKNMLNNKGANIFSRFFWVAIALVVMVAISVLLVKMRAASKLESIPTVLSPESTLLITNGSGTLLTPVMDLPQINIKIDRVDIFDDRYFIKGTLIQNDYSFGDLEWVDVSTIVLKDSTGKQIPIEPVENVASPMPAGYEFGFNTRSKGAMGDLTLIIPSADFHFQIQNINSPIFEVDFGDNPQENQKWSLDEDFDLAGKHVHLLSVTARTIDDRPALEFTMTGDSDVRRTLIFDTSVQSISSNDFLTFFQNGEIVTQLKYANAWPTGKHQFTFNLVAFSVQGNWQVSFDPASIGR